MRRSIHRGTVWLGPAALLLAMATGHAEETAPPPVTDAVAPPVDTLVDGGEAPDVVMFYTGDVIGYLEPCG